MQWLACSFSLFSERCFRITYKLVHSRFQNRKASLWSMFAAYRTETFHRSQGCYIPPRLNKATSVYNIYSQDKRQEFTKGISDVMWCWHRTFTSEASSSSFACGVAEVSKRYHPYQVTQKELFRSSQYSVIAESKHLPLAQPHHQLSFKAIAWFRWKVFNKQMRIPLNSGIQLVPKDAICMLQLVCEIFPRWPDSKRPSFIPWRWLRAPVLIPRLLIYHLDRDFVLTPARLSVTSKVLPSFPQTKQAQLKSHCFYKNVSPPYGLLQEFFSLSSTVNTFYPYGTTNKCF